MNTTLRFALALLLAVTTAQEASAQWNVERFDAARNQVYTTFGLDPALVGSVGYARVAPFLGRTWQLGVEFGVVAFEFDRRDVRAQLQARTSLLQWRSLRLVGTAAFITRGTENSIYRAVNFGSDITGAAGVYHRSWFLAGEFGFDKNIITHLQHSDWYHTYFYPEARDGWYLPGGGTFHYGVTGGVAIGPTELALRLGRQRTEQFDDLLPPVYASLGLGIRF